MSTGFFLVVYPNDGSATDFEFSSFMFETDFRLSSDDGNDPISKVVSFLYSGRRGLHVVYYLLHE